MVPGKRLRTSQTMSKSTMNFLDALAAVVVGNAIYFRVEKYLPYRAHHALFQLDVGMVVDFSFCLLVFVIIKTVTRRNSGTGGL